MLAGLLFLLMPASLWGNDVPVIRVAAFNYYPAIFLDADNQVQGFYVDMLNDIASHEQVRFEYVFGSWKDGLERLRSGEVDLVTSAAYTEERATFMDFGQQILLTVWGELYIHQDSQIIPISDLQDQPIAVMQGDYNAQAFKEHLGKFGINSHFVEVADFDEVFAAVKNKQVSAGVVNSVFGDAAADKYQLQSSGIAFNPFHIYFATAKGQHAGLLRLLDDYLTTWRNDSASVYFQSRLKWGAVQNAEAFIPVWIVKLAIAAASLLVIGLVFIVVLRYRVDRATRRLKKNEVKLQKSNHMIRLLLDSTAEAIYGVDPQGLCTFCNTACVRILGYDSADQLIGCSMHDLIHHSHADSTAMPATECQLLKGLVDQVHCDSDVFWRADGSSFPVEYWSYPIIQDGKNIGLVVSFVDITERKQTEEALVRQQRSIKLSNRVANVFLNSSRNDVFADVLEVLLGEMDSRFGYFGYIDETGDLVCPSMTRDIWHQCQVTEKSIVFPRSDWGGLWGRSLMEKQTLVANEKLRIPEGHMALENALATPIVHHDNLVGQFVVANKAGGYDKDDRVLLESVAAQTAPILFSIQEEARQKTAHEKLEAQLQQAHKMEAIGTMAGGIAHDFNNLLSIIIGNIDIVQHKQNSGTSAEENVAHIKNATHRAKKLVAQILAFGRQEKPDLVSIDLVKAVTESLKLLRSTTPVSIEIMSTFADEPIVVNADTTQLQQVILNLSSNAAHAMADKGLLTVAVRKMELTSADIPKAGNPEPGPFAKISVSDTGTGMDKQTLERIFDPFFTTKEVGIGTGMGLSVIHGIVERHGGFITVDSTVGAGSTFHIFLPVINQNVGIKQTDKEPPLPTGTERILFVDDEESIAYTCNELLEYQGYTVTSVTSGIEALDLFKANPDAFDLVITDQTMPVMTGAELATELLKIRPDIHIILCSGYSARVSEEDAKGIGIREFCMKPMDMKQLATVTRRALDEEASIA